MNDETRQPPPRPPGAFRTAEPPPPRRAPPRRRPDGGGGGGGPRRQAPRTQYRRPGTYGNSGYSSIFAGPFPREGDGGEESWNLADLHAKGLEGPSGLRNPPA